MLNLKGEQCQYSTESKREGVKTKRKKKVINNKSTYLNDLLRQDTKINDNSK